MTSTGLSLGDALALLLLGFLIVPSVMLVIGVILPHWVGVISAIWAMIAFIALVRGKGTAWTVILLTVFVFQALYIFGVL